MDHIGTVDHHVSGLIVGDQPAAIETICHFHQVGTDPTVLAHVAVESTDAFFRREIGVLRAKLGLHLASHRVRMLQVDHAAHFDRSITKRYPTGTEFVGPGAQIDQVVVSACAVGFAREVEANELSFMQVGLSLQELLVEVPETWHGAEILVLLRTDDLNKRFRSRKHGIKEMTAEVQNDVSIKEPLQPEVAVLSILCPQLLQLEACIGRLEPAQSLRCHVQCIAIADQWLDERSHAVVFLSPESDSLGEARCQGTIDTMVIFYHKNTHGKASAYLAHQACQSSTVPTIGRPLPSGSIMAYPDDKSMTKMGRSVHVPVTSENYTRVLFTAAALVMKLIAFFLLEKGDAADLGDEFSAMLLFVITLAFLIWQYVSIRRMAQVAEKEAAGVIPA